MSQATVKSLIDEILRLANRVSATERNRALEALNRAVGKYAQRIPWPGLKRAEIFVTDGTRFMIFPERVAKITQMADVSDALPFRPEEHFIHNIGAPYLNDTAGTPCVYRELGIVPVVRQPLTDSALTFSTPASEAMSCDVFGTIRDTSASGSMLEFFEVRETVVLAGAAVATTNRFVEVKALHKDRDTDNRVDVADYTGKVIARLFPQKGGAGYRRIEFDLVPGAGRRVKVEYFTFPDRINSELQPIDPAINLQYLTWLAVGDIHWMLKETQNAQIAWAKAEQFLQEEASKERTFGENNDSVLPSFTYYDLETLDFYSL